MPERLLNLAAWYRFVVVWRRCRSCAIVAGSVKIYIFVFSSGTSTCSSTWNTLLQHHSFPQEWQLRQSGRPVPSVPHRCACLHDSLVGCCCIPESHKFVTSDTLGTVQCFDLARLLSECSPLHFRHPTTCWSCFGFRTVDTSSISTPSFARRWEMWMALGCVRGVFGDG